MPHGPSHKTKANKIKSIDCISPKDTTPTLKDNLIISPIPTPYIVTPTPTPGILKKKNNNNNNRTPTPDKGIKPKTLKQGKYYS